MKKIPIILIAAVGLVLHPPAIAKDTLTIGITQFPSTFHPNIDSMMANLHSISHPAAVLVHDPKWNLICMLCPLPTIDNGLAMPERTPEGKQGIAVTFTIRLDATWGDGTGLYKRRRLHLARHCHKQTGVSGFEFYKRVYKINIKNDKTFTLHMDKLFSITTRSAGLNFAHLEGDFQVEPGGVPQQNNSMQIPHTKASISALTAYLR